MASTYVINIVKVATGEVVIQFPPGRHDGLLVGRPQERDLIETIADRVVQQPVGIFRTKAQVRAAVRQVLSETFSAVKAAV